MGHGVDTASVWLTPEIAHFVVSKYFSHSYASRSSPELHSLMLCHAHLCSAALSCALLCSLALCCTHSHSAMLIHALPSSLMLCQAHSCSAALTHALLCSLALCHAHSCSAMLTHTLLCFAARLQAAFLRFTPCPPGLPYTPHTTFLLSYHLYPCSWTLRTSLV
jgi:hypothetical protein